MFTATFLINDQLKDFLNHSGDRRTFKVQFSGHETVKHLIETLGIPHTEIDAIIVNGHYVDFSCILKDGDYVEVYPANHKEELNLKKILRDDLDDELRFVLDSHLGRLATYLRLLGYDTLYRNDYEDPELAQISSRENRYLLTRDKGLLKRTMVSYGYWVREKIPKLQLIEVVERFNIKGRAQPFIRCSRCNGLLQIVSKSDIIDCLEPKTILYYDDFRICVDCCQVYWKGSHFKRMEKFFESILSKRAE